MASVGSGSTASGSRGGSLPSSLPVPPPPPWPRAKARPRLGATVALAYSKLELATGAPPTAHRPRPQSQNPRATVAFACFKKETVGILSFPESKSPPSTSVATAELACSKEAFPSHQIIPRAFAASAEFARSAEAPSGHKSGTQTSAAAAGHGCPRELCTGLVDSKQSVGTSISVSCWRQVQQRDGSKYYHNSSTGQVKREHAQTAWIGHRPAQSEGTVSQPVKVCRQCGSSDLFGMPDNTLSDLCTSCIDKFIASKESEESHVAPKLQALVVQLHAEDLLQATSNAGPAPSARAPVVRPAAQELFSTVEAASNEGSAPTPQAAEELSPTIEATSPIETSPTFNLSTALPFDPAILPTTITREKADAATSSKLVQSEPEAPEAGDQDTIKHRLLKTFRCTYFRASQKDFQTC